MLPPVVLLPSEAPPFCFLPLLSWGGDTAGIKSAGASLQFDPLDADKDDYSQNCVGGAAGPAVTEYWQIHSKGQNVMFADGHSKWYKGYHAGEMTFAYNTMTNWIKYP